MARRIRLSRLDSEYLIQFYSDQKGFTLSKCELSAPEQVTEYVSVPGRFQGPLDLSVALTDGEPTYKSRTLEVVLECSEGTRATRSQLLSELFKDYEGRLCSFYLPDYSNYYLKGRAHIAVEVNDLAHLIVRITAVVEPWFYGPPMTAPFEGAGNNQYLYVNNAGAVPLRPRVVLTGAGEMKLMAMDLSWTYTLTEGTYVIPELKVPTGSNAVCVYNGPTSMTGVLEFDYSEAKLA